MAKHKTLLLSLIAAEGRVLSLCRYIPFLFCVSHLLPPFVFFRPFFSLFFVGELPRDQRKSRGMKRALLTNRKKKSRERGRALVVSWSNEREMEKKGGRD